MAAGTAWPASDVPAPAAQYTAFMSVLSTLSKCCHHRDYCAAWEKVCHHDRGWIQTDEAIDEQKTCKNVSEAYLKSCSAEKTR